MILQQDKNTPLGTVQVNNMSEILTKYRSWTGFLFLTIDDLYAFITTPSAEREEFLATLDQSIAIARGKYTTQTFN